jgi:antitoxin component YwqK of YwqJK toxin-antitoxin module
MSIKIKTRGINKIDSKGIRQGLWRGFDDDGKFIWQCDYVDGVPINYVDSNDLKQGLQRFVFFDGSTSTECLYVDNMQDGEEIDYYDDEDDEDDEDDDYFIDDNGGFWWKSDYDKCMSNM